MATPHINAEPGDFADSILLPGDPLRAKFIAETFFDDVREVTNGPQHARLHGRLEWDGRSA